MKPKHIEARVKQCLAIAECSPCPRRKFGALLLDPIRNTLLIDAYNGGPRGGGDICGGHYCLREGIDAKDLQITVHPSDRGLPCLYTLDHITEYGSNRLNMSYDPTTLESLKKQILATNPPLASGTMYEQGCHHAEMNLITNAAARGVATAGAWLIITGEPCILCAKLLHHAGISKVICVRGGFLGGEAGPEYLRVHGVEVEYIHGPQDPRLSSGSVVSSLSVKSNDTK